MSNQRFIPGKKKEEEKHCNCSKASSPYFSDRIRLIHSSLPTDFPSSKPSIPRSHTHSDNHISFVIKKSSSLHPLPKPLKPPIGVAYIKGK